ncbi:hypothetical protein RUM43_000977 [Polyplax serrata]|uniref:DM10 domain-containing protein n=1 Tax=Polyplax serrata TaxID=468196 RepID=A0AAN8XPG9_POLSC
MSEQDYEGLPLLPGLSFQDPTKSKFHRSQFFGFRQGGRFMKHYAPAAGKYTRDIDSIQYLDLENDAIAYDPSLTYGRAREYPSLAFRPHFVTYDKKCLTFKAFFKQPVYNSPDENYRVRTVNIIYFLDDDTITVMEPPVLGRLIRKGKIPKYGYDNNVFIHWKDFNVGIDLAMAGIVFHITDCDLFTKEFLLSQGVELNDSECIPPDPYIQMRMSKTKTLTRTTPVVDDKLRRFLEFEGRVLKFRAVWDDRDTDGGSLGSYIIKYYLEDDTVEVAEVHEKNDGKDPFPLLLKRTKLPKNWTEVPATYPSIYLEKSDNEVTEYYKPLDFIIGATVFVFGRRMLLHKCDEDTRRYYCRALNIKQPPDFEVEEKEKPKPPQLPPPHTGIGSLEDSLGSCLHYVPKEPKKDVVKQIINMNKYLRYLAKLRSTHPEDEGRDFIIYYSLADSTIKIMEPRKPNSGHVGGRFLSAMLVPKPGSHPDYPEYYSPADIYVGAIITVNEHRFEITGADLQVYRYMEANPEKFKQEVVETVRNYLARERLLKDDIGTVANSILNPEEFSTTKICTSDPNATAEQLHPCRDEPCTPAADYQPPKELPPECNKCPEPTGKIPEACKTTDVQECYLDPLSGKVHFNRDNPKWK